MLSPVFNFCESSVHFASATSIFAATNSSSIYHRSRKNESYAHGLTAPSYRKLHSAERYDDGFKFPLAGDCLVPKVQWDGKSSPAIPLATSEHVNTPFVNCRRLCLPEMFDDVPQCYGFNFPWPQMNSRVRQENPLG